MVRFISIMIAVLMITVAAHAADNGGFGSSFTNQAPTALGGETSTAIAAGEQGAEAAAVEPAAGEDGKKADKVEPSAGPSIKSDEEKELEERFNTDVTRTTFDRGDGNSETRDVMGDGKVGVYYQNDKDDKMNDSSDSIGVNVKILEFK